MSDFNPLLNQILAENRTRLEVGQRDLFVFDLDSTLFDVSPRIREILRDFSKLSENQLRFKAELEQLNNVELLRHDWGIKTALARLGLDKPETEFYQKVKEHWFLAFFSNKYLHHDKPYDGACEFVNLLHERGNSIAYLTGRDTDRMLEGTLQSLKSHGFPVQSPGVELVLKPTSELNDSDFKSDWFKQVPTNRFSRVWFFENEPLNANLISQNFPHINIIFFDSTHSGRAQPLEHLPKIARFRK